jgi:hypothetical protein
MSEYKKIEEEGLSLWRKYKDFDFKKAIDEEECT